MRIGIGIDTGGTCTDAVAYDYDTNTVLAKGKALTITDSSGTTSTYTFTTSNPNGLNDNSGATFEEREYFETEFIEHNALSEITLGIDNAIGVNENGKQSLRIFGATREWEVEHGGAANEHGSALHTDVHDKVFR